MGKSITSLGELYSYYHNIYIPMILSYYDADHMKLLNANDSGLKTLFELFFLGGPLPDERMPPMLDKIPHGIGNNLPVIGGYLAQEMGKSPEILLSPLYNILNYFMDATIGNYQSKDSLFILFLSYIAVKFLEFYVNFNQDPEKLKKPFYLALNNLIKDKIRAVSDCEIGRSEI